MLIGIIILAVVFVVISMMSCIIIGAEADEANDAEFWREVDECEEQQDESVSS